MPPGEFDRIVIEALWYDEFSGDGGMPWPSAFDERDRDERAHAASRDRMLVENANDLLVPNYDMADIADAYKAIDALRKFLAEEISEAFDNWFRQEYSNASRYTANTLRPTYLSWANGRDFLGGKPASRLHKHRDDHVVGLQYPFGFGFGARSLASQTSKEPAPRDFRRSTSFIISSHVADRLLDSWTSPIRRREPAPRSRRCKARLSHRCQ